jgi:hypothetical protein
MQAIGYSETSVLIRDARRNIPEEAFLKYAQLYSENFKESPLETRGLE